MLEPDRQRQERRTLAETLRTLRKAAGLSGERLAVRCGISQSTISRIESGKTLPSVIDVQRIVDALDVPDELRRELLDLARTANIHYRSFRSYAKVGLWHTQAEIKALTESSTVVRQFLPAIPSGMLQTESYARQVLTPTVVGRPARDVERAVRARMELHETLRDETRRFVFLLTEQAIRWQRAEPDVMAAQCAHMAAVSTLPNVDIAILPLAAKILSTPLHVFVAYDDRLVEVELFTGGVIFRDPKDVGYYLNIFQYFLDHALTGAAATAFLRSVGDEFMRGRG